MAGDQIQFDERMAAGLDVLYRTRDVRRRRASVLEALDAQPGDRVLDLGCGPGFYVADIAERVGSAGAGRSVCGRGATPDPPDTSLRL